MKNAYEVLQQKEADLARTRHEIDSLRITATLLADAPSPEHAETRSENSTEIKSQHEPELKVTRSDAPASPSDSRPRFWGFLKRAG
jgi:hypothetical protein